MVDAMGVDPSYMVMMSVGVPVPLMFGRGSLLGLLIG